MDRILSGLRGAVTGAAVAGGIIAAMALFMAAVLWPLVAAQALLPPHVAPVVGIAGAAIMFGAALGFMDKVSGQ